MRPFWEKSIIYCNFWILLQIHKWSLRKYCFYDRILCISTHNDGHQIRAVHLGKHCNGHNTSQPPGTLLPWWHLLSYHYAVSISANLSWFPTWCTLYRAYWTVGKSSETIENTRKNRGNAVKYLQRDSEVWKKKFAGDEDVSARRLWPA